MTSSAPKVCVVVENIGWTVRALDVEGGVAC